MFNIGDRRSANAVPDRMRRVGTLATAAVLAGWAVGLAPAAKAGDVLRFSVTQDRALNVDVSVQAQILNLFRSMKRELGLTYVFVSHNLGVIRHVSDRVAVMYQGRIVETGTAEGIFTRPQHAYTRTLLDAVPDIDPAKFRAAARQSA